MALLEVWELNHDEEWRASHPEEVMEHKETLAEVEANARLIAAAPDLLAALEVIASTPFVNGCSNQSMLRGIHEMRASARAAIAKAKGETP